MQNVFQYCAKKNMLLNIFSYVIKHFFVVVSEGVKVIVFI